MTTHMLYLSRKTLTAVHIRTEKWKETNDKTLEKRVNMMQNGQLPKLEYSLISYMMRRRSEAHKYKKYHGQK
jgi:hypothetical protein